LSKWSGFTVSYLAPAQWGQQPAYANSLEGLSKPKAESPKVMATKPISSFDSFRADRRHHTLWSDLLGDTSRDVVVSVI
jgi:hypothetical protein